MNSECEVRTQKKESHVALILFSTLSSRIGYLLNYDNIARHLNAFSKENPIHLSMSAHYVTN